MSEELTTYSEQTPRVPIAEIKAAQKELSNQVKSVVEAAQNLEQLALIEELPFEEALLLNTDELRQAKRYTAENKRQIEWRRKACVELLGRGIASTDIAQILSMNRRTVEAVAAQEGQRIAVFSELHAEVLATSAMGDIALAQTKRGEASYRDLHIAAGIKLTHAANLKLVSAGGVDVEGVLEVTEEDPRRKAFIERLKQIAPGKEEPSKR